MNSPLFSQNSDALLEGLNPKQAEAASTVDGQLLILAGAGSGKTRVLVHRIAYLVRHKGVRPEQIMAVTFTNKAAAEMTHRVADFLGMEARGVWTSTFHSACVRILRAHGHEIGIDPNFTIFDVQDQKNVMKLVLEDLELSTERYKPAAVLSRIEQAKQQNKGPDDLRDYEDHTGLPFAKVYRAYQNQLRGQNALDFGDLLYECVRLWDEAPHVLELYHRSIHYLMVDEYQDTNRLQYLWTMKLAAGHNNLCVVGDDDQSIYSWRGADIQNILDFQSQYPDAKVVKLEQNYRSTKTILSAAHAVIEHNRNRTDKKLWTENDQGANIRLHGVGNDLEESSVALDWLLRETATRDLRNRAVFYRTNAQSRLIEEACIKRNIPYRVYGGVGFYSRKEVKDVLSYLRFLANPTDITALQRIINEPKRGIGKTTIQKILVHMDQHQNNGWKGLKAAVESSDLGSGPKSKVIQFTGFMIQLRNMVADLGVSELAHRVLEYSGYLQALKNEQTEEAKNRIENLDELLRAMEQFEQSNDDPGLAAYLQSVMLLSDIDADAGDDTLSLMTMHMAKGLEFDRVAIVGMEEELFPSARALADNPVKGVEEERRLCYVGMTRARQELGLFYAQSRRIYGQMRPGILSRFVEDIPKEFIDNHTASVPMFGAQTTGSNPFAARRGPPARRRGGPPPPPPPVKSYKKPPPAASNGPKSLDGWSVGERVSHPSLGVGQISAIAQSSVGPKLTVTFGSGSKVILPKYVALQKV